MEWIFFQLGTESALVQATENVLDAVNAYLLSGAEYQVYCGIAVKQVPQDSIYRILECGPAISETKWHHRVILVASCRSTMVNEGAHCRCSERSRIRGKVLHSDVFLPPVIHAGAENPVLLDEKKKKKCKPLQENQKGKWTHIADCSPQELLIQNLTRHRCSQSSPPLEGACLGESQAAGSHTIRMVEVFHILDMGNVEGSTSVIPNTIMAQTLCAHSLTTHLPQTARMLQCWKYLTMG